ncbi:MAG TPA: DDE-type integrase/transposase/recombinase [Acidimicrobiales bacterium]
MDLAKYCVNAVLVEGRSVRTVAAATGRSKSWVHRHVALYRAGGDEALTPQKRGPKVPANLTSATLEGEIVGWRKRLAEDGLDAGARTIAWHLHRNGTSVPSLSTIHRVLRRRGFVTPQPQKRPRSSWTRFESNLPNETWQSDMTHWHLADEQPVEIINFIDDYSRAVLTSVAVPVATAADVVRIFFETAGKYGLPRSVLSDNGAIYTAAYRGSHTGMEIELATLGITFKHGKPYHPAVSRGPRNRSVSQRRFVGTWEVANGKTTSDD